MDERERELLESLLTDRQVATLAVAVNDAPFASLVPFVMSDGFRAALIHASSLAKFPKNEMTFQLGDFTLYALRIETVRFVAGFAKTFDLTPTELANLT